MLAEAGSFRECLKRNGSIRSTKKNQKACKCPSQPLHEYRTVDTGIRDDIHTDILEKLYIAQSLVADLNAEQRPNQWAIPAFLKSPTQDYP
jgi:hypothetical protein